MLSICHNFNSLLQSYLLYMPPPQPYLNTSPVNKVLGLLFSSYSPNLFQIDKLNDTAQKMKLSIKDFFSKSVFCGFGHIY